MTDDQYARIEALKAIGPETIAKMAPKDTVRVADVLAKFIIIGIPPKEAE